MASKSLMPNILNDKHHEKSVHRMNMSKFIKLKRDALEKKKGHSTLRQSSVDCGSTRYNQSFLDPVPSIRRDRTRTDFYKDNSTSK